jgi:hypothetical protein
MFLRRSVDTCRAAATIHPRLAALDKERLRMSSTTTDDLWFYSTGDSRLGPVTKADISQLKESGTITDHTLIWQPSFGTEWRPFHTVPAFSQAPVPPPLPQAKIDSTFANIYAAIPFIGLPVEEFLRGQNILTERSPVALVYFGYMIVYAILQQLDFRNIAKSGNETVNTSNAGWTLILAPVYLFIRDKRLGFQQWRFAIMLVGVLGGMALASTAALPGLTAGLTGRLPVCTASTVTETVRRTFGTISQNAGLNVSAREVRNITETSADSIQRMCAGTIMGSDERSYPASFRVYLEDGNVMIYTTLQ